MKHFKDICAPQSAPLHSVSKDSLSQYHGNTVPNSAQRNYLDRTHAIAWGLKYLHLNLGLFYLRSYVNRKQFWPARLGDLSPTSGIVRGPNFL